MTNDEHSRRTVPLELYYKADLLSYEVMDIPNEIIYHKFLSFIQYVKTVMSTMLNTML